MSTDSTTAPATDASKYLLTNGQFRAKCNGNHGVTQFGDESRKPKYFIEFELLEGPDKGKRIQAILHLEGGGTTHTKKVLETCGWDPKSDKEPQDCALDNIVRITLEDETWKDKTSTRVKWVNAENDTRVSNLAKTKLDPRSTKNAMSGLVAAWRKEAQAEGGSSGMNSYAPPGNEKIDTSDIPF